MSSHENATPIRVLHNSAGHLSGPARPLGGVVVGYLGVRVFSPRPVATMIDNVGGCSVLLGKITPPSFLVIRMRTSNKILEFVFIHVFMEKLMNKTWIWVNELILYGEKRIFRKITPFTLMKPPGKKTCIE